MADKKEVYSKKAMEVFKQNGLRLSIEEIAEKIGVTKKTLYNHFSSKDDLLSYCMHGFVADINKAADIMTSDEINAIEGLYRGIFQMGNYFQTLSPRFFFDLKKTAPELASTEHSAGFNFFLGDVINNLKKGKKEWLYRPEINEELIGQYFVYSLVSFFMNRVLNNIDIKSSDYFREIVDYHLHSVTTEKGRAILAAAKQKIKI